MDPNFLSSLETTHTHNITRLNSIIKFLKFFQKVLEMPGENSADDGVEERLISEGKWGQFYKNNALS